MLIRTATLGLRTNFVSHHRGVDHIGGLGPSAEFAGRFVHEREQQRILEAAFQVCRIRRLGPAMTLVHVLTTVGSRDDALALAHAAVDERVAARVQVVGPITSVYRWNGAMEEAPEFLCVLKAPREGLDRLVAFVRDRHPYDTPEITAIEAPYTDERYLEWARAETVS